MIATLVLAAATQLVPPGVRGALVLESPQAAQDIRALLQAASAHARGLEPDEIGGQLARSVGVNLLAEARGWGLAPGARVLVLGDHATGLSAPVRDPKAARRSLAAWVGRAAKGQRATRAGRIVRGRLLIASGAGAQALVALLAKPGAGLAALKPALSRASGPLWLYVRGKDLLRAGIFSLEAGAKGLAARGIVLPLQGTLLQGGPGPKCEGGIACLGVNPGDTGRQLLRDGLRALVVRAFAPPARENADATLQRALSRAEKIALRVDGFDARRLRGGADSLWALQWSASAAPAGVPRADLEGICLESEGEVARASFPCGGASPALDPGPDALALGIDLAAVDAAAGRMSPLDALKGEVAAGVLAAHLLYGRLLQHAGPLTLRGNPARDLPAAAELELRLPLH